MESEIVKLLAIELDLKRQKRVDGDDVYNMFNDIKSGKRFIIANSVLNGLCQNEPKQEGTNKIPAAENTNAEINNGFTGCHIQRIQNPQNFPIIPGDFNPGNQQVLPLNPIFLMPRPQIQRPIFPQPSPIMPMNPIHFNVVPVPFLPNQNLHQFGNNNNQGIQQFMPQPSLCNRCTI